MNLRIAGEDRIGIAGDLVMTVNCWPSWVSTDAEPGVRMRFGPSCKSRTAPRTEAAPRAQALNAAPTNARTVVATSHWRPT